MNSVLDPRRQPSPSNRHYRADVDGLRAIAVIAVIVYHLNTSWLPGGFAGVDVFFVISGFVVTRSILSRRYEGLTSFSAWFYARRIKRILPALVVSSLVVAALPAMFMPALEAHKTLTTGFSSLFGLSNLRAMQTAADYFSLDAELDPYTHTWSLGVEEQFYLVFPALLALLCRPRREGRFNPVGISHGSWAILGILMVASIVTAVALQALPRNGAFYLMPPRFWELGAGVAVAFWSAQRERLHVGQAHPPSRLHNQIATLSLALLVAGFLLPFRGGSFPIPLALPSVTGAVVAICVGTTSPLSILPQALGSRVLVWLGKRSYSLYLWHWPVFVAFRWTIGLATFVHVALALGVTLFCATLAYRFVEQPVRRSQASINQTFGFGALILAMSAGILLVAMRPNTLARTYLGRPDRLEDWAWLNRPITLGTGIWQPDKCSLRSNEEATKSILPSDCRIPNIHQAQASSLPRRNLVLLGSSFAEAAVPMLRPLLARETGMDVSIFVSWGCLPGTEIPFKYPWGESCRSFFTRLVPRVMADAHPGDIVVLAYDTASLTDAGPQPDGSLLAQHETNQSRTHAGLPSTPQIRRERLRQILLEMSAVLKPKNVQLVFQATLPLTIGTNPRRCQSEWFRPQSTAGGLCPVYSRQHHLSMRMPVMAILQQVKKEAENFHVFDPFDAVCPGERCDWFENGRPIWRDNCHISEWKSEQIGDVFYEYLLSEGLL